MLATTLRRTAATTAAARASTRCFASAPVDFEHFSSGWEKDSSEYQTEGKFHIETFNKISPLVSCFDLTYIIVFLTLVYARDVKLHASEYHDVCNFMHICIARTCRT